MPLGYLDFSRREGWKRGWGRVIRRWRRFTQKGVGVGGRALTDFPRQGSVPSLFVNDTKSEN